MSAVEKRKRRKASFEFLGTVLDAGWIKDFSIAIDGGANVGDWAIRMAEKFDLVLAFEASPEIYADLIERTRGEQNIKCHPHALLDDHGVVKIMHPEGKGLRSLYVQRDAGGSVRCIPIDSLALPSCGFIKLDLEGAEIPALIGATETIKKFRPALMLEVDRYGARFGFDRDAIARLMKSWNYVMVGECQPDQVFVAAERL